jgi:cytochrome c oxidase cbb3-type subunit 3
MYLTIVWAIGYTIVYPAWPMINKGTEGLWGWTSRGQLAQEMKKEQDDRSVILAALAKVPVERLPEDSTNMQNAIAGGAAAFKVNCVQCHGSGAAGSEGYPNLNDDDWLWGGDIKTIETTLTNGIRQPGDDKTRMSLMPAFGRDGLLTSAEIDDVTSYVLTLSGKAKASAASARGAQTFEVQCATCHGADGKGLREFGAPNLADAIWLYGGSRDAVKAQIHAPRHGVMPAWEGRLNPVTIKMLAAYVHSLGGGEDFVEVAENPAKEVDEQP